VDTTHIRQCGSILDLQILEVALDWVKAASDIILIGISTCNNKKLLEKQNGRKTRSEK